MTCINCGEPIPIDRRSNWYCTRDCQIEAVTPYYYIVRQVRKHALNVRRQAKMYNVHE